MTDTPPVTTPPSRLKRIWHHSWRTIAWLLIVLMILVGLLIGLTTTTPGLNLLVGAVNRLSGGLVSINGLQGSLWQSLQLDELKIASGKTRIQLNKATLTWHPTKLLQGALAVDALSVDMLILDLPPSNEPTIFPSSLRAPLAIHAKSVSLNQLKLVQENLVLSHLVASLNSTGVQHELKLNSLTSQWGALNGKLSVNGDAPYVLSGEITGKGGLGEHPIQLEARLRGDLKSLQVALAGHSGQAKMLLDAQLAPFASSPPAMVHSLRGRLHDIDLPSWVPGAPKALLNGLVYVEPHRTGWRGKIDFENRQAGTVDAGAIPVDRLVGGLGYDSGTLQANGLVVHRSNGNLRLNGTLSEAKLALEGIASKLDTKTLHQALKPTAINGTLKLSGSVSAPALMVDLTDALLALQADLLWQRQGKAPALIVKHAKLTHEAGRAELTGQLGLDAQKAFQAKLELDHFKPQALAQVPPADINLTADVAGALTPGWSLVGQFNLLESKLGSLMVKGQGTIKALADRIEQVQLALTAGTNQLTINGALGESSDTLQLVLQAPDLNLPEYQMTGAVSVNAKLTGAMNRPSLIAAATAQRLRLPGDVQIAYLASQAKLEAEAGGRLDAQLTADGIALAGKQLNSVQFKLDGTRAQHHASLAINGQLAAVPVNLRLVATGALSQEGEWQGMVNELENTGLYAIKLLAPLPLTANTQRVALQSASFNVLGSPVQLEKLIWQPQGLEVAGQGQLDTARLLALTEQNLPIKSSLVLDARWQLVLGQHLDGTLVLKRRQGDLVLTEAGTEEGMPLHLSGTQVELQLRQDLLNVVADITSTSLGGLKAKADGALANTETGWGVARTVPLRWRVDGEMASIAWVGPLLGPMVRTAGRVALDVTGEQIGSRLQLGGWVHGNDLVLNDPDRGLSFKEGLLRAELQQDQLLLKDLLLKAGKGQLSGSGTLALSADAPSANLMVKAERFAVLTRPDRQLVISGTGQMRLERNELHLDAKLKADEGLFLADKSDSPTLGNDVVIVGRTSNKPKAGSAMPVFLTAGFDLGDKLKVQGFGLDATLGGALIVKATPRRPLSASGTVQVEKGRYAAYGQKLVVTRGLVNFQGPLDNPSLDILAVRENLQVEVGVQVAGTAQAPRVTLYSDTPMPDTEKVSWLVLGHSGANMSQGDAGALLLAASGLLGGDSANSFAKTLAETFGLDEIGVGSGSGTNKQTANGEGGAQGLSLNTQVITLGKRLSDRVYLAYEQGLTGASAALKLTYQISKRLSVVARAGQRETHVDVQFTHRFDTLGDQ